MTIQARLVKYLRYVFIGEWDGVQLEYDFIRQLVPYFLQPCHKNKELIAAKTENRKLMFSA